MRAGPLLLALLWGALQAYKPACEVILEMEANIVRMKRNVVQTEVRRDKAEGIFLECSRMIANKKKAIEWQQEKIKKQRRRIQEQKQRMRGRKRRGLGRDKPRSGCPFDKNT